jgi:asparagine synthase (glutamine-hydrolysing)
MMGGLSGIVDFGGPVDRGAADRMQAQLRHRGPDGEGAFDDQGVSLRHRLRKVVPGRSREPVVTDDVVVLMDGWLFDHEQVALEVGHDPVGHPDVSTLVAAWRRWGAELGRHVEGEYAAAVYDRKARTLTLLRDRLGTRPLYWCRRGSTVAFASDLPALLEADVVPRALAREHLAEYLAFQAVHAPRTLLRDIFQVEPGHWLMHDADGVRSKAWWAPSWRRAERPESELVEQLQGAVDQAVRRRVPAGVDAGILLSGGLGSAAIATAAKARFLELPTFTVSFDDDPHPESPFAGRVAQLLDLEHHEVTVGSDELASTLNDTVAALGHPVGHPAAVLQLALARAARKRVRMVLSGDGGAELFGGRMLDAAHRQLKAVGAWERLPRLARRPLRRLLGRRLPAGAREGADPLALGLGGARLFDEAQRRTVLRDPGLVRPRVRQEVLEPWYRDLDTDPLNTVLHGALRSSLQGVAIPRADRTAAAAGLDVRYPLLDAAVVDASLALPGHAKLRRVGGALHTRWPLRAMLSGALPPALLNRPRRGLPTPLGAWLAGPGRLLMESRLRLLKEDAFGLYDVGGLDALRREVTRSNPAGIRLWALILLDTWLRQTLKR